MEFYVNVTYEKPPQFCQYCNIIGHYIGQRRRRLDVAGNQAPRTATYRNRNFNKIRRLAVEPTVQMEEINMEDRERKSETWHSILF